MHERIQELAKSLERATCRKELKEGFFGPKAKVNGKWDPDFLSVFSTRMVKRFGVPKLLVDELRPAEIRIEFDLGVINSVPVRFTKLRANSYACASSTITFLKIPYKPMLAGAGPAMIGASINPALGGIFASNAIDDYTREYIKTRREAPVATFEYILDTQVKMVMITITFGKFDHQLMAKFELPDRIIQKII